VEVEEEVMAVVPVVVEVVEKDIRAYTEKTQDPIHSCQD
jgi:hypothetical protein